MRTMEIPTFWELKAKAKAYYPDSAHMRVQWLRHSAWLYASGKHILLTGAFSGGRV